MPPTNPPTKDNLESDHFLSEDDDTIAALTRCLRVDPAHFGTFSQPSRAIQAIREGLMILLPRFKAFGMEPISDPTNTYGDSTAAAVLVYKKVNAIQRVGRPMDNVCGRMTLARLDTELANPLPVPPPPPPIPQEFGSNSFSFHLLLIKDGRSVDCNLFIKSNETNQDSRNFQLKDVFSFGFSSCECETRGNFVTDHKLNIQDFKKPAGGVNLTRLSRTLRGFIDMTDQQGKFDSFKFAVGPTPEKITFPTDGTLSMNGTWVPDR